MSRKRSSAEPKARRIDAVRNEGRVLDAARAVFAERGIDVPLDVVAERAKVGIGTVFRHYPTKDALLAAVIGRGFEELADQAEAAARESDPGRAFERFVRHSGAVMARDRGLVAMARARVADRHRYRPEEARLFHAVDQLIAAARKAGAVRPGITAEDVAALLAGIGDAAFPVVGGAGRPGAWERYVAVVLDGLRSPGVKRGVSRSPRKRRS